MQYETRRPGVALSMGDLLNDDEVQLDRLESSWADFAHGVRTGMRYVRDGTALERMRCLSLTQVREQFDAYRQRHASGDPFALIGAVKYACEETVPLPHWLSLEVQRRIKRIFNEPVSLHASFGLEDALPVHGKKATNARRRLQEQQRLWHAVQTLRAFNGFSLSAAIEHALVEGSFTFGVTVATRLFHQQERTQRAHAGRRFFGPNAKRRLLNPRK